MRLLLIILSFAFIVSNTFGQRGKDGAKSTSVASEVVNAYTTLTANANIGATTITVANSTLNIPSLGNLEQGDLIMIYQVQGASLDDSLVGNINNWSKWQPKWGQIIDYNNCGNYEFVQVRAVPNGTTINLDCALTLNYTASGNVVIVRVPRYSSLTVNTGHTLTVPAWNGSTGGVLAIEVDGTTTINAGGNIDVSALGFRGGQHEFNTTFGGDRYADSSPNEGAEKGEGIGGDQVFYDTFNNGGARYCRGAAANAGGGGDAHNAGGGGGANAGNPLNWNTGNGVPNPAFNTSWALETPSIVGLNSSGGGRGGYSHAGSDANELTIGPGNAFWGGDTRRQVGGLGGRPLDYSTGKIFMGGAGGAGDGEDNTDGATPGDGGNGAGIIFMVTYGDVNGAGNITANGQNGGDCEGIGSAPSFTVTGKDAAGGGGAGGTVIIKSTGTVSGVTVTTNGGNGGDQILKAGFLASIGEAEGPGGGGGGGYIAITSGSPTTIANGGFNGITNSSFLTNFNANGATDGGIGMPSETINAFDISIRDTLICNNTSVTLTALITGVLPVGSSIEWYDAEYGGNLLFTGNPFVTPVLSSNTTYYIKVCPSPFSIPVTVTMDPCLSPVASFSSTDSTLCAGDCIDFTDLTSGITPTSWSWHFFGSSTPTSSVQNPTNICYNSPGNYNVALAVSDGTNSDSLFISNFITVSALDTAAFTYSDTIFCTNDPNPLPNNTGTLGGTYTINNSGVINAGTGLINITGSGVGAYTVTYITNGSCPDTATFSLSIFNSTDATINQEGPFCLNDPSLNLTGANGGGVWSGVGITDTINGTFDPNTAGPGSHVISYTIPDPCGDIDTMTIVVIPKDTAAFTYSSGSYCLTDPDPLPTITGTTGGTFSIDNSGTINSNTGLIDISGSGVGAYVVTYITNGTCPDTATFNINITTSANATITQAGPFCENDPSVTLTAVDPGGNWTGTGITNATTGDFDPNTAGPGNHVITYTISGSCGDVDTMTIVVIPKDTAAFTYPSGSYCLTDPDPLPTITGTTGGSFTIDNSGVINSGTGLIDVTGSGVGAYVVTYITNGTCPDTATFNINIVTTTDATITQAGPFCENDPSVTLTAVDPGGNWTGTGITNATTGDFDPNTAGPGNHVITYTISGSCGDIDTMTIVVNPSDDASFSYSPTTFCDTDPNPLPAGIVTVGGTFTIDNSGTINGTTGEVNLLTSGPGSYIITYTTNGPCPSSDTVSITITNCSIPPVANLSATNTSVCINDCVDYTDISTGGTPTSWNWYFEGATPNTSSQQNPSNICYDTLGTFGVSLMVSNAFGNDSIYIANYITVDSCNIIDDVLIIPNVFSPNGDGENDLFKPYGTNISTLYMAIYNRWGELIYRSELINSGWDGRTTAGALCTEGTYFYLIEVNGETYKGTVTMLR
ncbi:MAG: gliding motility-associated C-terminal domain-containing protein [Vicingaceae bacterium]|nr:gliding motility-associated C-terminal domain-containing protein [Vicingaceae bacterium]